MEKFDLVIIGAGPGGYPAAIRGAQLGMSVALVEREDLGGTCLNWGCIPTKLFIGAAELFHSVRNAEALGIKAGNVELDYATLVAHKDQAVTKLRGGVGALLKLNGVRVFKGSTAFVNPECISGAGRHTAIESYRAAIHYRYRLNFGFAWLASQT